VKAAPADGDATAKVRAVVVGVRGEAVRGTKVCAGVGYVGGTVGTMSLSLKKQ
jgi:hypothetical protein